MHSAFGSHSLKSSASRRAMQLVAKDRGKPVHHVRPESSLARQKVVDESWSDAGNDGDLTERQFARMDGPPQLATEGLFLAGFFPQLVARLKLGQFCFYLGAMTGETVLLFLGKRAG